MEEDPSTFSKPPTPKRKRRNKAAQEGEKGDPRIQKRFESLQKPDSTTIYSKHLAEKLDQFDPRTKSILAHKINKLIFETEMDTLYPGNLQFSTYDMPRVPSSPSLSTSSTVTSPLPAHENSNSPSSVPEDPYQQSQSIPTSSILTELQEYVNLQKI